MQKAPMFFRNRKSDLSTLHLMVMRDNSKTKMEKRWNCSLDLLSRQLHLMLFYAQTQSCVSVPWPTAGTQYEEFPSCQRLIALKSNYYLTPQLESDSPWQLFRSTEALPARRSFVPVMFNINWKKSWRHQKRPFLCLVFWCHFKTGKKFQMSAIDFRANSKSSS